MTDRAVQDEGEAAGDFSDRFYTLDECKSLCDMTGNCHSFIYIELAGHCHLKDKCVTASDPLVPAGARNAAYRTFYKTCEGPVGLGHCINGQIYASQSWELASSSGGHRAFHTSEYKSWVQEAMERCRMRNSQSTFVSVWQDAAYRCYYTASSCTRNSAGNVETWRIKAQNDVVPLPPDVAAAPVAKVPLTVDATSAAQMAAAQVMQACPGQCTALYDATMGWKDYCEGLTHRPGISTAELCRASCCADLECSVWQFQRRALSYSLGFGGRRQEPAKCYYGRATGSCRRASVDVTILAGQRVMHGVAEVIAPNLAGLMCPGLKEMAFSTGTPEEQQARCKRVCESDTKCAAWQWDKAGNCHHTESTEVCTAKSSEASLYTAGERLVHLCPTLATPAPRGTVEPVAAHGPGGWSRQLHQSPAVLAAAVLACVVLAAACACLCRCRSRHAPKTAPATRGLRLPGDEASEDEEPEATWPHHAARPLVLSHGGHVTRSAPQVHTSHVSHHVSPGSSPIPVTRLTSGSPGSYGVSPPGSSQATTLLGY